MIYKITAVNGYDLAFVDKIFHRHQRAQNRKNNTTLEPLDSTKRRICLPFYPAITNHFKRILKPFDIQIVVISQETLRNKLCNYKGKPPPSASTGIYSVPCLDCDLIYIGQTRRSIATRIQEHPTVVNYKQGDKSSVEEHAIVLDYNINSLNAGKLKMVRDAYKLDAWESLFITNVSSPLMNKDEPPIISPLFGLA